MQPLVRTKRLSLSWTEREREKRLKVRAGPFLLSACFQTGGEKWEAFLSLSLSTGRKSLTHSLTPRANLSLTLSLTWKESVSLSLLSFSLSRPFVREERAGTDLLERASERAVLALY